jgi:hypothetical protein
MNGSRGSTAAGDPACRGGSRKRLKRLLALGVTALVLGLVLGVIGAGAHQWNGYSWPRRGSAVHMYIHDLTNGCGTSGTPTNDALYDIYYNPHPVYIHCVGYNTDINVFRTYEPGAPYCGLAQIWTSGTAITHGEARWNSACQSGSGLSGKLYQQQIYCQEVMHTLGMQHSNTYDCMGGSYYSTSNGRYYVGSSGPYVYDWDHQSSDLYYIYRY